MVPEGRYAATAVSAKLCESKKGIPFVGVEFKLTETNEHITWTGWLSEKTEQVTIRSLRYCGWEGYRLTELDTVTTREVSLVIEHDEYEGKTRAKVRWVNPLGGLAAMQALTDTDAESLSRSFETRIAAIEAEAKKAAEPVDDDSAPF